MRDRAVGSSVPCISNYRCLGCRIQFTYILNRRGDNGFGLRALAESTCRPKDLRCLRERNACSSRTTTGLLPPESRIECRSENMPQTPARNPNFSKSIKEANWSGVLLVPLRDQFRGRLLLRGGIRVGFPPAPRNGSATLLQYHCVNFRNT